MAEATGKTEQPRGLVERSHRAYMRHKPGAMKNTAGSSGTITDHHTNSPVCGASHSNAAMASAQHTLTTRNANHSGIGTREGICR
ncbi:hypothetical protein IGB42_01079 [Andreprevotia sp. IGB-42]|nr:hypothetical protein IGB42_01079 [Andreprevotia sp. IGB-42]